MPCERAQFLFCAVWFPIPLTVLQLQEKITSYFITKLNLTFPRTQTEPNPGSLRTRTEPNPNNEGSFPSLDLTALAGLIDEVASVELHYVLSASVSCLRCFAVRRQLLVL